MNLQQLYYFRTIAELEHYTKAANQLMVSQPSLSHSINDLEQELGVNLFERQGRNVQLTKYGAILLDYVQRSLDTLEEGKAKLNDFICPDRGVISMNYFSSLEAFIPYIVAEMYKVNGTGTLNTFQFYQSTSSLIETSLLSGAVDLSLSVRPGNERLRCHKVGEHNVALIVPANHVLASRDHVDLSTLEQEHFITYDSSCQLRTHIDNIFNSVHISPQIVLETQHDTMIYSYVAAGFGVALVPEPLGATSFNVKALPLDNALPPRDIFLCWKDVRYMSPAVKKFRDFVVERGLLLDEFRRQISRI